MMTIKNIMSRLLIMICIALLSGCYVAEDGAIVNPKTDKAQAATNYILLAQGYLAEGDTAGAKAPLKRAMELNKTSPEANAAMGLVYQKEGEPLLAEQHYKKALEYDNGYTAGRNLYAIFLYSQGRIDEAIGELKVASEDTLYDRRAQIFLTLGLAYRKSNNFSDAESAFKKVILLDIRESRALLELADIKYNQHDFLGAHGYYNHYLTLTENKQYPRSLWLGIRIARALNDKSNEVNYANQLKNTYGSSQEYLLYKDLIQHER